MRDPIIIQAIKILLVSLSYPKNGLSEGFRIYLTLSFLFQGLLVTVGLYGHFFLHRHRQNIFSM